MSTARVLSVFLSSPGDCQPERQLAHNVVARINNSPIAKRAALKLELIEWEALPPGEAEAGDLQSRISDSLKRYGLDRYDIYLGFFKDRLGTPTPRARSGTIEELDYARRHHKSEGHPEEVLLYFVSASPPAEVVELQRTLSESGFLFSTTPTSAELERRLETHLEKIVEEWDRLRKRALRVGRRVFASAPAVLAVLLVLAAAAYFYFDRGGLARVEDALSKEGARAAAETLAREGPYMLMHRSEARALVTAAIEQQLDATDPIAALELFAWWIAEEEASRDDVRRVRAKLVPRVRDALELGATSTGTAAAGLLWQRADEARLWEDAGEEALGALERVAAVRLAHSMAASIRNIQPMRPWERRALEKLRNDAPRFIDPRAWSIVAAQLGDWTVAGEAVKRALVEGFAGTETLAWFVGEAPAPEVLAFFDTFDSATPQPSVAVISKSVAERGDPVLGFALLDKLAKRTVKAGAFPAPGSSEAEPWDRMFAHSATGALARLAASGGEAPIELTALLVPPASRGAPTSAQQEAIAPWLVGQVENRDNDLWTVREVYPLLARLEAKNADAHLRRKLDDLLAGRISYAIRLREGLLLSMCDWKDRLGDTTAGARLLARSRAEAASLGKKDRFGYDDRPVRSAYVEMVARCGLAEWSTHSKLVEELIALRIAEISQHSLGLFDLRGESFDFGVASLMRAMTDDQLAAFFDLPNDIVMKHDPREAWPRWLYLLQVAATFGRKLPPNVARSAWAWKHNSQRDDAIADLLARHAPEATRAALKIDGGRYQHLLCIVSEGAELGALLSGESPLLDAEARERCLALIDTSARATLIVRAALSAKAPPPLTTLLAPARIAALYDDALVAEAERLLDQRPWGGQAMSAVGYLAMVANDRLYARLDRDRREIERHLRHDDAMHVELAQELKISRTSSTPDWLLTEALRRPVLLASGAGVEHLGLGGVRFRDHVVFEPLLENLEGLLSERSCTELLDAVVTPRNAALLGEHAENAADAWQSYALTRATSCSKKHSEATLKKATQLRVLMLLDHTEPAVSRSAAALLLAAIEERRAEVKRSTL